MRIRWLTAAALTLSAVAGRVCADAPRDPMRPPLPVTHTAAPVERRPALTGIRRFGEQPSAILDDTVVHVGDRVGPYTVLAILDDRVLVRRGESTAELRLEPPAEGFKKPSSAPPRTTTGDN